MSDADNENKSAREVASRSLIKVSVLVVVALLVIVAWLAFEFLLLLFAAILFGVLINGISCWISEKTPLSRNLSMGLFFVLFLTSVGLFGWLVAPSISDQVDALSESLPEAVERLRERADESEWVSRLMEYQDSLSEAVSPGDGFSVVTAVLASIGGALTSFVVAFAIGVCLAINPRVYVDGFVKLIPLGYRARTREVLSESGSTLQSWLIAKLIEMLLIGVLTTLGLWLLGIELALVLGLIAGLLSFIPNIGPVIAVIPALLLASMEGTRTMLYVAGLYTLVQVLESYVFTPWMQNRIVSVPPALTISLQLLFGLLAGTLGLLLATPLGAVGMVMIRMLYVEDVLGDRPDSDERLKNGDRDER
ncbi:AI-2E family transporter [Stutzerimonas stutzeri]|uniref:AI-2E family transporter n=1 Tax=Stutzerimonas stutzeri TaxID=316 RepID=UPI00210B8485|nr:AI-2E family transporter [Stutzerimonas stutzeri]MCQ4257208.1 AI-2E family transporter [Stutzerimonas stutzeri]